MYHWTDGISTQAKFYPCIHISTCCNSNSQKSLKSACFTSTMNFKLLLKLLLASCTIQWEETCKVILTIDLQLRLQPSTPLELHPLRWWIFPMQRSGNHSLEHYGKDFPHKPTFPLHIRCKCYHTDCFSLHLLNAQLQFYQHLMVQS